MKKIILAILSVLMAAVATSFAQTSSQNLFIAGWTDGYIAQIPVGSSKPEIFCANVFNAWPDSLAFNSKGDLFVACGGYTIVAYFPAGSNTPINITPNGAWFPSGLAINASDDIFVADYNANVIWKIDSQTKNGTLFCNSGINGPASMAFDSHGNLYVVNFNNSTVSRIDAGSNIAYTYCANLKSPWPMVCDSKDNIIIDNGSGIMRINAGSSNAIIQYPDVHGNLALDKDDNLYISSPDNHTISFVKSGTTNLATLLSGINVPSSIVIRPQNTSIISILLQPTNVSLTATNSQTATFSVVATNGVPPYAYQWMKDGVDLTNQTNPSLVFSNAGANKVGYYTCDVTDQNGTTVTSSNAALNITGVNFSFWQGLLAYYPFNGTFNDSSFTSNHLINPTPGLTFTANRFGKSNAAIYLGRIGVDGYHWESAESVNPIAIVDNQPRSISLWFKDDQWNGPWKMGGNLISFGQLNSSMDNDGGVFGFGVSNDYFPNGLNFGGSVNIWGGWADYCVKNLGNILQSGWHHIVYSYSGAIDQSFLYLDGKQYIADTTGNHVNQYCTPLSKLHLGEWTYSSNGNPQGGMAYSCLSDVRIYNRALSSNEVSALYQSEAQSQAPGTNNQTITFPGIPPKPYGTAPFTLAATSSAGTNYPISYTSSDPTIATVSSNKVTITGVGSCQITTSQPGDFIYKAATNVSRTLTVTQGNQTIAFSALASRSYTTKTFTLPLNSSAGLPVSYSSSSSSVATISGNVVTITGPGSTVITATQDGNANYKAAPTVNQTLVVSQAAQTITFPAIASKAYGAASFNLGATATSGLPITYTSSNTNVATVSGNTVTIKGVGSTTITASQAGNANYVAAPSVGQSLTVTKAAQTITFTAPTAQTYGNSSFTLSASSSSGLPVTFTSANTNVATVSGNTVTIVGAGSASITASQSGNANYNAAANVSKTLTVAKAAQTVSFSPITPVTYVKNGTFSLSATSSSGSTVTFSSGNTSILSISSKTATMKAKGTVNVTATAAATTNYNAASKTNSITLQ